LKNCGVKGDILLIFAEEFGRTPLARRLKGGQTIYDEFTVLGTELLLETWSADEMDAQIRESDAIQTVATRAVIGMEMDSIDYIVGFYEDYIEDILAYTIGNISTTKICIGFWGANGQRYCHEAMEEFAPNLPLLQITGFSPVSRYDTQLSEISKACGEIVPSWSLPFFQFGDGFTILLYIDEEGEIKSKYFT
jgi:hypothetical protein